MGNKLPTLRFYCLLFRRPCKIETIAPHIRVLFRDIPYILYISAWFVIELQTLGGAMFYDLMPVKSQCSVYPNRVYAAAEPAAFEW